jgi:hypothetical protein
MIQNTSANLNAVDIFQPLYEGPRRGGSAFELKLGERALCEEYQPLIAADYIGFIGVVTTGRRHSPVDFAVSPSLLDGCILTEDQVDQLVQVSEEASIKIKAHLGDESLARFGNVMLREVASRVHIGGLAIKETGSGYSAEPYASRKYSINVGSSLRSKVAARPLGCRDEELCAITASLPSRSTDSEHLFYAARVQVINSTILNGLPDAHSLRQQFGMDVSSIGPDQPNVIALPKAA